MSLNDGGAMIELALGFMFVMIVAVVFLFFFGQLFRKKEGTVRIRKRIFLLGVVLLCVAALLFCLSFGIIQGLYRSSPNAEFALEDTPEHRYLRDIGFTCFFASIVLGIIGIITIVYGAGAERKSQETKQVLNNESVES